MYIIYWQVIGYIELKKAKTKTKEKKKKIMEIFIISYKYLSLQYEIVEMMEIDCKARMNRE